MQMVNVVLLRYGYGHNGMWKEVDKGNNNGFSVRLSGTVSVHCKVQTAQPQ